MDNCNNYLTLSKCTPARIKYLNPTTSIFHCLLSNIGSLNGMIKYVPTYSIEILSRNAKRNNCTKSKSNPNKASIRQSLNSASSFQVYLVAEDLGEGPYLHTKLNLQSTTYQLSCICDAQMDDKIRQVNTMSANKRRRTQIAVACRFYQRNASKSSTLLDSPTQHPSAPDI